MTGVRRYLAQIGSQGGRKSRRTLDPETARTMVRVREARRDATTGRERGEADEIRPRPLAGR